MQGRHEWKAYSLTLGDLIVSRRRYERISKRQLMLEKKKNSKRYYEKSAEVIVSRQRAVSSEKIKTEDSQKDEGPNVRMANRSESL